MHGQYPCAYVDTPRPVTQLPRRATTAPPTAPSIATPPAGDEVVIGRKVRGGLLGKPPAAVMGQVGTTVEGADLINPQPQTP